MSLPIGGVTVHVGMGSGPAGQRRRTYDALVTAPEWVDLGEVATLGPGKVRPAEVAGVELAVWRGVDGVVCVLAGRCPHQGSHLGTDGVVDGTELVCEAHFWRFDRTGWGSKLNLRGRRDHKADVAVYPVREREGRLEVDLGDRSADG